MNRCVHNCIFSINADLAESVEVEYLIELMFNVLFFETFISPAYVLF